MRQGQHLSQRELGHCDRVRARCIRDRDVVFDRCLKRDHIDSRPMTDHAKQVGRLRKQGRRDGATHHDNRSLAGACKQIFVTRRTRHQDVREGFELCLHLRMNRIC